jgi:hypothetical protein
MELSSHFRELRSHFRAIAGRSTKQPSTRNLLNTGRLTHSKSGWHGRCLIGLQIRNWNSGLPKRVFQNQNQPETNYPTSMSEEINKPEAITDEQLEDVAGGMMDNTIANQNCFATLSTINL